MVKIFPTVVGSFDEFCEDPQYSSYALVISNGSTQVEIDRLSFGEMNYLLGIPEDTVSKIHRRFPANKATGLLTQAKDDHIINVCGIFCRVD